MPGAPSDSFGGGLFHTASASNMARSAARRRKIKQDAKPKVKSRAAYFAKRRAEKAAAKGPSKRDTVAELLAEGFELNAIAEHMGLTAKAAQRHLEAIRKRLGPQAT